MFASGDGGRRAQHVMYRIARMSTLRNDGYVSGWVTPFLVPIGQIGMLRHKQVVQLAPDSGPLRLPLYFRCGSSDGDGLSLGKTPGCLFRFLVSAGGNRLSQVTSRVLPGGGPSHSVALPSLFLYSGHCRGRGGGVFHCPFELKDSADF